MSTLLSLTSNHLLIHLLSRIHCYFQMLFPFLSRIALSFEPTTSNTNVYGITHNHEYNKWRNRKILDNRNSVEIPLNEIPLKKLGSRTLEIKERSQFMLCDILLNTPLLKQSIHREEEIQRWK